MKKSLIYILPALLLLTTSCGKMGLLYPRTPGSRIVFGTSTRHGASTKAAYTGEPDPTTRYQKINWEEGDLIRIFCAQAEMPGQEPGTSDKHFADYKVATDGVSPFGTTGSSAKIEPTGEDYLTWGEAGETHYFSALYPAPTNTSGTSVSENTVTCCLPDVQTNGGVSGTDPQIAAVNKDYLFLAGYGEGKMEYKDGDEPVNIYFDPAVTTFEFTLESVFESGPMTIKSAGITTTADNELTGTYDVYVKDKIDGATSGEFKTLSTSDVTHKNDGSKTITMNFSPSVSVEKDKEFTFTLFAQPGCDITKLTFWMIDDNNIKRSFPFKYTDSYTEADHKGPDNWVKFTAFHKARIKGLMAPESAGWIINMVPVVVDWIPDEQEIDADAGSVLTFSTEVEEWNEQENGNILYSE